MAKRSFRAKKQSNSPSDSRRLGVTAVIAPPPPLVLDSLRVNQPHLVFDSLRVNQPHLVFDSLRVNSLTT